QNILGELEQSHPVRDRGLRPAYALRDLTEGKSKLIHEHGVRARLLDRREVLAGHIPGQREHERLAVVALADEGGDRREPGCAGRAPAALAGDALVAAAFRPPDENAV